MPEIGGRELMLNAERMPAMPGRMGGRAGGRMVGGGGESLLMISAGRGGGGGTAAGLDTGVAMRATGAGFAAGLAAVAGLAGTTLGFGEAAGFAADARPTAPAVAGTGREPGACGRPAAGLAAAGFAGLGFVGLGFVGAGFAIACFIIAAPLSVGRDFAGLAESTGRPPDFALPNAGAGAGRAPEAARPAGLAGRATDLTRSDFAELALDLPPVLLPVLPPALPLALPRAGLAVARWAGLAAVFRADGLAAAGLAFRTFGMALAAALGAGRTGFLAGFGAERLAALDVALRGLVALVLALEGCFAGVVERVAPRMEAPFKGRRLGGSAAPNTTTRMGSGLGGHSAPTAGSPEQLEDPVRNPS